MKLYKLFNLIALFQFGSIVEIKAGSEGLLPPTPENRTITDQLERRLGVFRNRRFFTPCTTNDTESLTISARNGLTNRRFRWQNFDVYMDSSFSSSERALVNNAMFRLAQELPCVSFRMYGAHSSPSGDYVHIVKRSGCWSRIGKVGGRQELRLGRGCWDVDTIIHEMIHALGFDHEHNRPDRDDYVTIHWGNVQHGLEYNFRKRDPWSSSTFDVPYNIHSIMHYGYNYFSVSSWLPTITTKSGETFQRGKGLQQTDIFKLKRMYNC